MPADERFENSLARTGTALLKTLAAFEAAQRRLHPPDIPQLREHMGPLGGELGSALDELRTLEAPAEIQAVVTTLADAAELAHAGCVSFCEDAPASQWIVNILGAMRKFAHALETLYPLHLLPPIGRFFTEPALHGRLDALDPEPADPSVGLHATDKEKPGERGGFCLYVPERYRPDRSWPLVVSLHGGSGSGREYLWVWVREARSRGFLVLSPTSIGSTWSMMGPDVDAAALRSMVEYVCSHWNVDRERVLLTGLSDGATYGLLQAFSDDSPYSAVAAISGVLHPRLMERNGLANAAGKRIYLVHGALDWMFPIEHARMTHEFLARAGADIVFREIADLSHTYPREENDRILSWFDPSLALPGAAAAV